MKIRFKFALLISVFWLTALPSPVLSNSFGESDSIRTESLNVHLNTTFFVAGESLLFRIYCVDAKGRPSIYSSTAYVELIGKDKKPLAQIKVKLLNGIGTG